VIGGMRFWRTSRLRSSGLSISPTCWPWTVQYQADQGHAPAALQELVPDYLADAVWDPLHGGPFGYRLLDDDRHARAYLLYSFGADGVDDGGRFDQDDSRLGFSRAGPGCDVPLNPPRDDGRE
jgi:hypothetical protein